MQILSEHVAEVQQISLELPKLILSVLELQLDTSTSFSTQVTSMLSAVSTKPYVNICDFKV